MMKEQTKTKQSIQKKAQEDQPKPSLEYKIKALEFLYGKPTIVQLLVDQGEIKILASWKLEENYHQDQAQ